MLLSRPAPFALSRRTVLVLGMGATGQSVARWVESEGGTVRAADTRQTGPFQPALLDGADLVAISPGLSLAEPVVAEARGRGIPVVGDIELFAWHVRAKTKASVLAITGTNGKTTVTSLTGHLLRTAGVDVEVAGNIAPPALDALAKRKGNPPAVWVLELSSYQLETTWSLAPDAAAMLNVSEDHLDRYASIEDYAEAKARIFDGAGVQVLNRDDERSLAMAREGARMTFGLDAPEVAWDFGVADGFLVHGRERIVPVDALKIHGAHNASNALAASALAVAVGLPLGRIAEGLRTFSGLPHRVELVATRDGVEWYDDSKGTNVGATIAALRGLGRKAVLILGGEGKGQDFSPLRPVVAQFASHVLLIGRDASAIAKAIRFARSETADSLEEAVRRAARLARPGEAVLLSPACASFDMFRDYKHRGEVFAAAVRELG
ncbi:MAG TPA: UDP-N-acetylmuramoyl-L-alanine--D-glutamate ligase [Burkholderiales bacterium]|nr:UDP-N-acetylmuramoyl-L-alanine--D-glutamate ligase [Burkholderiales bacterium]